MHETVEPPLIKPSERGLLGHSARSLWLLDDSCTFLNHGSFGATPREVQSAQDEWRAEMERQPVRFMTRILPAALRQAADELAAFLGTAGESLVFVDNATAGINAVLRSIDWRPGDQILYTDHGYGAINKTIEFTAGRTPATPVKVMLPFPLMDKGQIIRAVEAAITPQTRLAVLDHVTSPTAVVMPVAQLIELCHARGTAVLVDGAHAPGMLPLNLDELGADYYAGNCHKWLFAAKGCGFLWAKPSAQADLHPTVISWGWPDGFTKEFDWTGTRDPSAWLSITAAIAFYKRLPADRRQSYNNALAQWSAKRLEGAWQVPPSAPDDLRAAMATVLLPGSPTASNEQADKLHDALIDRHGIEVPIINFGEKLWVRISAQSYNEPEDYERLIDAVGPLDFECLLS